MEDSEVKELRKRFLETPAGRKLHSLIATKVDLGLVSLVNAFNLAKYIPVDEQPFFSGPAETYDRKEFHELLERRKGNGTEG